MKLVELLRLFQNFQMPEQVRFVRLGLYSNHKTETEGPISDCNNLATLHLFSREQGEGVNRGAWPTARIAIGQHAIARHFFEKINCSTLKMKLLESA